MEIYLKRFDDKLIKIFDTNSEKKKEIIITTVKDYQKEAEIGFYVNNKKINSINFKNLPLLKAREINIPLKMELINKKTILVQYKINNKPTQYFVLQLPKEKRDEEKKEKLLSIKPSDKKWRNAYLALITLATFLILIYIAIMFLSKIPHPSLSIKKIDKTEVKNIQEKTEVTINKKFDKELLINYITQNTPIYFLADSILLLPEEEKKIIKICEFLQNYFEIEMIISGHTEPIGKEQNEMRLSIERAKIIEEELKKCSEKNNLILKIKTIGYGSTKPFLKNAPDELKFKNRRVEIEIIEAKGKE